MAGALGDGGEDLAARLRLTVVTHPRPACGKSLVAVVDECLQAGATSIQLRDKRASAADLLALAVELRALTTHREALFIVNDRFDLALAAGADGVHLGPDDLPVSAVRSVVPGSFIIGFSADNPDEGRAAERAGASYLGVGAVYGTSSKSGLQGEKIGVDRLRAVTRSVSIPTVGIGGITPESAAAVYGAGAGVAVLSAVMGTAEPGAAVRAILATRRKQPDSDAKAPLPRN